MVKYVPPKTRLSSTKKSAKKQEKPGNRFFEILKDRIDRIADGITAFFGRLKNTLRLPSLPGIKRPSARLPIYSSGDMGKSIEGFFTGLISWMRNSRVLIIGVAAGILLAFIIILIVDFYRVRALADFKPSVTTKIYDQNGILISELFRQRREVVPIKRFPPQLINAFISIEDNEFYDHFGVNPKGIVRAFFINVFHGRIKQGGSTITQQLAKILLTSRERSIYRKIKEAFIAIMMEFTYSKEEILSLYLNQIFLGHGTYGVEAASQYYFDKHVWELNLAECALLASLPSAPNRLSPIRHPRRSMSRHRTVFAKMVEMGFTTVKEAEKSYLDFWTDYRDRIYDVSPTQNTWSSRTNKAPWFTEYVRRRLIKRYGEEMVYEKGLLVYTTLDVNKQAAAQEILASQLEKQTTESGRLLFKNDEYIINNYTDTIGLISLLFDIPPFQKRGSRQSMKFNNYFRQHISEELEGINLLTGLGNVSDFFDDYKKSYRDDRELQKVEGCLVSINQKNGYIEAMVGGSEFSSINQLNRVLQSKRQPGSAIKPLLYAAAIESRDFTAATTILDSPIVYLDNEGGHWLPENYEGTYYGLVRLREALLMSINVVSIRIAEKLGIDYVMKYMAKLLRLNDSEAKSRIPRNLSIVLGSMEVSPMELTRAYAIIANGGKDVIPFGIRYVKDRDGNILENEEEEVAKTIERLEKNGKIQVIQPETAQIMISLMKSVVSSGTGQGADFGRPAGGKTGTTNNWKDAWFVGFVSQLTTGIWVGYDKMGLSLGINQTGGSVAAPIWKLYMTRAMRDLPAEDFPGYAQLNEMEVCKKSGLIPGGSCRHVINEIFIPGTEPDEACDICSSSSYHDDFPLAGPKENISQKQKETIMRDIHRKSGDDILERIQKDLLE